MMELILLLVLVAVSLVDVTSLQQTVEFGHRRLDYYENDVLKIRHNKRPHSKPVEHSYPRTKFTHLMASDCRPTQNGFFGSTAGAPAIIEYGFSLETTVFSDVDRILDIIDEHVMDEVLSTTYPNLCATAGQRRKLSLTSGAQYPGRVTGFKFEEESIEEAATCDPEIHQKNKCAFFKSTVKVFGHDMNYPMVKHTLDVVRDALPASLHLASKFGAVRLVLSEDLTRAVSIPLPRSTPQRKAVGPGAAAGLIIAFFVLIVCIVVMIFYCRADGKDSLMKKKQSKRGAHHHHHHHHAKRHGPTRREREFRRYFDHNNDGSLTNTLPETESDSSDRASWRREAFERYWYEQRHQPPPRQKKQLKRQHKMPSTARHQRCQQQTQGDMFQPVVVEFGNSFDPERDRFVRDMEEESSAPPSYMFDPNAPPDFLFVYDQYERYDPYAEFADQYPEGDFEISEIQII